MQHHLRIGLVIDDSLDRPDGVQQHVLTLGGWLSGRGHEVHYLTSTTRRTDIPRMHSLGRNLRLRFNGNRLNTPLPADRDGIRTLLADVPFDVLHVNMPYSPLLAGQVVNAAGPDTAVVGTFHILPWSGLTRVGTRALGLLQRRQLTRFSELIAVSEPARVFAHQALGRDCTVIGNPVEVDRFTSARDVPAPDGRPPRILFLGRLVERKGALDLLRAVVALRDRHPGLPPFTVRVAGTGPLEDALAAYAQDHGIADLVELTGYVPENDKADLLADAEIVALPSSAGESFGISVVEALAASRGVVLAGDNPGYRAVMRGLEDQLVDPKDPAAFADLLAAHLADPAGRVERTIRQLETAREYDVEAVGLQVLAVYRRALAALLHR